MYSVAHFFTFACEYQKALATTSHAFARVVLSLSAPGTGSPTAKSSSSSPYSQLTKHNMYKRKQHSDYAFIRYFFYYLPIKCSQN
jgi:hypothetical protein